MSASLLIAGIEVIDQSVNANVRLAADPDFGEGEPDQAMIGSIYLDGESVTGDRVKNRQPSLPLNVYGVSGTAITATIDALRRAVNVKQFTIQWTPDGGLPLLFDAYKATVTRVRNPVLDAAGGPVSLLLTCQARPFGRSPSPQSVTAATGSTQLDSFATAPTGAALDTSVKFEGTGSARVTLAGTATFFGTHSYQTSSPVSRSYGSAKDLSADTSVTMRFRWPVVSDTTVTATLTLLDGGGGSATITAVVSFKANATNWQLVSFPLTGDLGTLNPANVTGYSLSISTTPVASASSTASFWVDDQRGAPPSSALATTTHAANLLLPSTVGSARAPANLALTASGGTFTQFLLHSPPGDQDPDAQILTALNTSLTDQVVTLPVGAANLRGTFSLVLGAGTAGTAGQVEVTVTQYENGSAVGSIWDQVVATNIGTNGKLLPVGEITLPLYDTPADNSLTSYTIRVQMLSTASDKYSEVMLLDTKGQTIWTDGQSLPGSVVYVDEPGSLQSGPGVFVSGTDRSAAFSKLSQCVLSGGPILVDPSVNKLLAFVDAGTPTVTATYYPRWLDERVS